MLEVDLLRGGSGPHGRRPRLNWPHNPARGLSLDLWTIGSGLTILASLGLAIYLVFSVRGQAAALEETLHTALADSVHARVLIEKMQTLEARRDSIAARVAIIREIDAQRYLWPRIMDEVAGVLPGEAWLTSLSQVPSSDGRIGFQVEGMTRDNHSLTRFWNGMESSPFIHNVRLISTETEAAGSAAAGSGDLYRFVLRARPEYPPPAMLDLVPFPAEVPQ